MDNQQVIESEAELKPGEGEAVAEDAAAEETDDQPPERDFDAEAKRHGWTPKDEFKGDPAKWVDAETFVKRADEVMPFLKKQNTALKRDIDDLKRQMKQAAKFFSAAEERAYARALTELEERHEKAVEEGDTKAAKAVVREMRDLARPELLAAEDDKPDPEAMKRDFAQWVEDNDWYVKDANKRLYADMQAAQMGPAQDWPEGSKAWLDELKRKVERKFAEKKPSAVNGGGNREKPGAGGKTFADLPPEAKAMADKWVKSGLLKNREEYVKGYDFGS